MIHPPFAAQKTTASRTTETISDGRWPPTAFKSLVNSDYSHSTPSPISSAISVEVEAAYFTEYN
jgi:hypothetical protein